LDDTGLYYYGARFYDPAIGRFISPDSMIQAPANPQSFNRYSYVINNPLKYTDPTGHEWTVDLECNTVWEYPDGTQVPDYVYYAEQAAQREQQQISANKIGDPPLPGQWEKQVQQDPPTVAEIITEVVFDTVGQVRSLPNTIIGLGFAVFSGGDWRFGPGGTIVVENVKPNSPTRNFMNSVLGGSPAFTVGYVILTKEDDIRGTVTEYHELGHVTQSAILGGGYIPAYIGAWLAAGRNWNNAMEVGRGHPTWPRR